MVIKMNKRDMKLKYYMRGLGIGIILTTVIMSIAVTQRPKEKMTEKEIIEAARELGMVMEREKSANLNQLENDLISKNDVQNQVDNQNENQNSENQNSAQQLENDDKVSSDQNNTSEDAKVDEQKNEDKKENKEEAEDNKEDSEENKEETEENKEDSEENKEETEDSKNEKQEETTTEDENVVKEIYITFQIKKGMISRSAAQVIYDVGLIDSVSKFDQYLIDNGYSNSVMVGEYRVKKGSTYEEIAKIITK